MIDEMPGMVRRFIDSGGAQNNPGQARDMLGLVQRRLSERALGEDLRVQLEVLQTELEVAMAASKEAPPGLSSFGAG